MKYLIAFGFFIIQPALWIGVIRSYLIHINRLKKKNGVSLIPRFMMTFMKVGTLSEWG